ncbi:MAG: tetratricopeptide repeat protein [Phycisphaerae bacterium]
MSRGRRRNRQTKRQRNETARRLTRDGVEPVPHEDSLSESIGSVDLVGEATPGRWPALLISIALVGALVAAVHWPALSAQALSFDDSQFLADNPLVQNPGWDSAKQFLVEVLEPSTVGGYYLPLSMISLMTDYAMGGRVSDLMPFHRTSLILHILNTGLIILLLYALFGRVVPAAAAGLLFGVHPLTVEPIAWVGERKTLLAAFFALCCLMAYVRHTRRGGGRWLWIATVLYLLALLSKPTAAPLPLLLILVDYWPLRRLHVRSLWEKTPFFILAALFAVITLMSHARTAGFAPTEGVGPLRIPLTIGYLIPFYLGKIAWPTNLSSVYPLPDPLALSNPGVIAGLAVSGLLIVILVYSRRRTRALLCGGLFFFVAILPTLGVVQYSWVTASDKYVYLPAIGLLMVLAWAFCKAWAIEDPRGRAVRIGIVAVVMILAGVEARGVRGYLKQWRDTETLSAYMLTMTPNAAPVHINLGSALDAQGRFAEAVEHYRKALEDNPNYLLAHNNLGASLAQLKRYDEAITQFRRVIEINDRYAEAHNNLAAVLLSKNEIDEAIRHCRRAIELKVIYPKPYYNMGNALVAQNKLDAAIAMFRTALRYKHDYVEAHDRLADVLQSQNKLDEAIAHYRLAIRFKPDYAEAHDSLGFALGTSGKVKEAIEQHRAALRIDPKFVPAHVNLGYALASMGRFDEAIEHFQTALRLDPANGEAYRYLALAFQKSGRLDETIETYRRALSYDPKDAESHNQLGTVLTVLRQFDAALPHFRAAMRLQPGWPQPVNGAAWILATHPESRKRDSAEAVRLAEQAAEWTRRGDAEILDTLGAAYAAAGDFQKATFAAEAALKRSTEQGAERLAQMIRSHLELYRQGIPCCGTGEQ